MGKLVIRNDDVNPNTDLDKLNTMYSIIKEHTNAEIISAINIFAKRSNKESVYPDVPFKDKPVDYFLDVDCMDRFKNVNLYRRASHGLYHFDHTKISKEWQKFSIQVSCKMLCTTLFVPPFNRFSNETEEICDELGINLLGRYEYWRSLDFEEFDSTHSFWYFHSWKFTLKQLKEKILNDVSSKKHRNRIQVG